MRERTQLFLASAKSSFLFTSGIFIADFFFLLNLWFHFKEWFYKISRFIIQHKWFTNNVPSHSTSDPPVLSDRHFSLARARQISYSSGKQKPQNIKSTICTHLFPLSGTTYQPHEKCCSSHYKYSVSTTVAEFLSRLWFWKSCSTDL